MQVSRIHQSGLPCLAKRPSFSSEESIVAHRLLTSFVQFHFKK